LIPIFSTNKKVEERLTLKVIILGYQPFDLCLLPGNVNGLQDRCKQVMTQSKYGTFPVPLLLRLGVGEMEFGQQKVLGSFYDFEPFSLTPDQDLPSCCHIPLVKSVDLKLPAKDP
jgi:hypothetical protein